MKEYYFPKCLLPVHERPILFEIIKYWLSEIDEVVIVLNRSSGEMIKKYIDTYFDKNVTIKYCYQEKRSGTYFAIKRAVEIAKNKEYILNWSDILLTKKPNKFIDNSVFVTSRDPCRWKFEKIFINIGKCDISNCGIYGVFILNNLDGCFYVKEEEKESEVEILEKLNSDKLTSFSFEDFIDIGDLSKYNQKIRMSDFTRSFGSGNEIEFTNKYVIKNTSNKKLANCEQNWYKNVQFDFVPKVYGYNPLKIEKIADSEMLSDCLNKNNCEEKLVIENVFQILEKIHTSKESIESIFEDSFDQYYKKTIDRLERVDFLFKDFENNIIINGKKYENPKKLLIENKQKIEEIFSKDFRIIHGDLQLSNRSKRLFW